MWTIIIILGVILSPVIIVALIIAIALILSIPIIVGVALHLKYYVLYGLMGFFMVGWFDDVFGGRNGLWDDYIRGVSYPIHVAYHNVKNIYADDFHILDFEQNTLFYFWLIPGLTFSTYYPLDFLVTWVYPITFLNYTSNPFDFIDEDTYNTTGISKPKEGFPRVIA